MITKEGEKLAELATSTLVSLFKGRNSMPYRCEVVTATKNEKTCPFTP